MASGTYTFSAADCMCSGSALCISGPVTIEAEVAGSVVLDANGKGRVFEIQTGGQVELIGLDFKGGHADWALGAPGNKGAGLYIADGGVANLDGCLVYENEATGEGGGLYVSGMARLINTNVYKNEAIWNGGGLYVSGTARLINTSVYENEARINTNFYENDEATGNGGGLYISGTATLINTNVFSSQAAHSGANLYLAAGSSTAYVLPTPPGHWVPATKCEVWREAANCGGTDASAIAYCRAAEEACKENPIPNATDCLPTLFSQPCDWSSAPELLGETVYVLPLVPFDGDFPYACSPGLLGGNGSDFSEQKTAACAGLCPAGFVCGAPATIAPTACLEGRYCPEGTSTPLLCEEGTYSNAIDLTSAAQCRPTIPGYYATTGSTGQTPCSPGTVAPNHKTATCSKCDAGTFQKDEGQTACEPCTPGSFCPEGASAPLPCEEGTYSAATNLTSAAECTHAQPGYYATTGSTTPTPCSPGTMAPNAKTAACEQCGEGKFQNEIGQPVCRPCTPGYYCTESSSAPLPCPAGKRMNLSLTVMTSADDCIACGEGTFCPVGSEEAIDCSAGTYNDQPGQETCAKCAAGTYQPEAGETECQPCEPGHYCKEGAAAALPCEAGTYSDATNLTSADECTETDPGFYATTGSTAQTQCSPGTYTDATKQSSCTPCEAGSYQKASGATACEPCTPGHYCAEGAAAALPCEEGTYSDATDLTSAAQCAETDPGFYATTGSTEQLECRPGTVATGTRTAVCTDCEPGKFMNASNGRVCHDCPPGHYCEAGASAALPCAEGTYSDAIKLTSAKECTETDPGLYATTGSTAQTQCSPGTVAPSAGMAICVACEPGTFQDVPGQLSCRVCASGSYSSNVLSCELCQVGEYCPEGSTVGIPCPFGFTTKSRGAKSADDCGCRTGTFDDTGDGTRCMPCSAGMACTRHGLVLATVPLPPSRWRHSNRTADIHACDSAGNTSACLGGDVSGADGSGYCLEGHVGPRCEWCSDASLYYDAASASCKACGNVGLYALRKVVLLLAIGIALALLRVALTRMPHLLARTSSRLAQLAVVAQHFGLQAKFKSCLLFYQIWSVRESVYGFSLPSEFSGWLSWLEVLSFDVGTFIFPSWTCVGGLTTRLAFNGLWPLLLMVAVALTLLARAAMRKSDLRAAMLRSLETAVFISFCVLPSVTRSLFLAFQCESFGVDDLTSAESKSYLTASLNVECTGEGEHGSIIALAVVFLVIWPVAMPLLYAVLLHRCRHAIVSHQPTALSRAISFLWSEYEDLYCGYELVMIGQKLVLTNVVLFLNISGGSEHILRLIVGLLIALLALTLQLLTQPFQKPTDDALNCAVQLVLVLFFTLGIVVKLCDTGASCSALVGVSSAYDASVVMICAGLLVLFIPIGMFARQLFFARAVAILRDASTREPPILLLRKGERYHLFLSHIWSTGQDQVAVIKRQLQLLLPGIIVFLDVDDLQDIGNLEGYVRASGVMLFFLSKKYFQSRNCLREIRASLEQEKPLVLVHEQQEDKGGGPLAVIKAECRDDEMRAKIYNGRTPIVWHRISHYQNLTLKLIATEMLSYGPRYGLGKEEVLTLVLPGEVNVTELALSKPLVLWCSAGNSGATEVAREVEASMASSDAALQIVDTQPDVRALRANGSSAFMLLYLNEKTWVEQGDVLERDVRAAREGQPGLKIIMLHENDPEKGGCDFGLFFSTTPQELIDGGIYSDIAIALHTPPHRSVSLALVAQAVGATKQDALTDAARRLSKKTKSTSEVKEVELVSAASSSEESSGTPTPIGSATVVRVLG